MTAAALALVLGAAGMHATWNLLAKRAGGGAAFVWLFGALSSLLYAPLALWVVVVQRPHLGPAQVAFMAGSAVLHTAYFVSLQQGYRAGDLSLVYPLARGTGPLLSTLAAVVVFGERPSLLAAAGALLIAVGVFVLAWPPHRVAPGGGRGAGATRAALVYGLRTGAIIACYTLWDKRAVSALLIPPLLQDWAANLGRAVYLAPVAARRWDEVRRAWRTRRLEVLGVALLTPLAYILVLQAMTFTPVSYVAPAREVSVLLGAALGARFLSEGDAPRRLVGAAAMVAGIAALALG